MPVRDKAVDKALRAIVGDRMAFNNVDYTARVNGEHMTRDEFNERYWDPIERVYEIVVDAIDWNRVLLEASQRHMALDHPDHEYYRLICPECVCEALLADATFPGWQHDAKAPRHHS